MKTRILSGLIMVPLLAFLYFGGYPLMVACFAIGIVGLYEFYKGFHAVGSKPNYIVGALFTLALYVMYILGVNDDRAWMLWLVLLIMAGFISCLYKFDERTLYDGMATVIGVIYVVFFSFHVVLIDHTPHSILVWVVVL
ncbi:MAG: phosphatidate cytidylyltransferase, partial [Firmicutes bacterium]|nr:phosphatidate cytidylyltransferase [Bacillota bacterium]